MFRTRRQNRYKRLREAGFLRFEAQALSKVPQKTPYMRQLVADRKAELKKATAAKLSATAYTQKIKERYHSNRWLGLTRKTKRVKADPWKMLRDYEDRYRAQFPQYESPWQPKRRDFVDYTQQVEQQLRAAKGPPIARKIASARERKGGKRT